jgi:hypothetical protein
MGKTLLSDKVIFLSASEKNSSLLSAGCTADRYEEEGRKEGI